MDAPRSLPEEVFLTPGSPEKLKIQNQFLAFVVGDLERDVEGHRQEGVLTGVHENPYALFVVREVGKKFRVWFEFLCSDAEPESKRWSETSERSRMTTDEFLEVFDGKPSKVLEQVTGHSDIQEYLRELEVWFRVGPAANGLEEDEPEAIPEPIKRPTLSVPLGIHDVRGKLGAFVQKTSDVELS